MNLSLLKNFLNAQIAQGEEARVCRELAGKVCGHRAVHWNVHRSCDGELISPCSPPAWPDPVCSTGINPDKMKLC